jgi:hypothetical protein
MELEKDVVAQCGGNERNIWGNTIYTTTRYETILQYFRTKLHLQINNNGMYFFTSSLTLLRILSYGVKIIT